MKTRAPTLDRNSLHVSVPESNCMDQCFFWRIISNNKLIIIATLWGFCIGSGCSNSKRDDMAFRRSSLYAPPPDPFEGKPKVIVSPSGERLCSAHVTPLVTVDGFTPGPGFMGDPMFNSLYRKIHLQFPNHIAFGQSLVKYDSCLVPAKLTYCPKCQEEILKTNNSPRK